MVDCSKEPISQKVMLARVVSASARYLMKDNTAPINPPTIIPERVNAIVDLFLKDFATKVVASTVKTPKTKAKKLTKTDDAPTAEPTATEETAEEVTVDGTAKKLYAPIQGTIVPRNEIPDDTFAAGVLGNGVGIDPEEGVVVAPFDGEISSVTDTKHAIGITGPADMEVLIHVGVDTVNMKGDGFELLVEEGQKVKAGQKLMTFDIAKIKAAGYSPVAAVLLTNSDDYPEFKVVKTGKTQRLEEVFTV